MNIEILLKQSKGQTRLLYHCGYWDGPHNGVMLWNGERVWFASDGDDEVKKIAFTEEEKREWKETCDNSNGKFTFKESDCFDYEHTRWFNVYRIHEKLMNAINHEHELFRKYVGTHTDYNSSGKRGIGAAEESLGDLMPYDQHDKFYGRTKKRPEVKVSKYKKIGRFCI